MVEADAIGSPIIQESKAKEKKKKKKKSVYRETAFKRVISHVH